MYQYIFFNKKSCDKIMSLKTPQNLKKMLKKFPVSNAWAAVFKNTDFSKSSFKVTKLLRKWRLLLILNQETIIREGKTYKKILL